MEKIIIGIVTAIIGFISGLLTPWVKWLVEKQKRQYKYRQEMVRKWKAAVESEEYEFIDSRSKFLSTEVYSSLRAHIDPEVVKKMEKPRTIYVGGARGGIARKVMLLDEIAKLEKKWKLI